MKKKFYTRPVSIVLSIEMFEQIKAITDQIDISISDFIRNAIKRKLDECNNIDKQNKNLLRRK
jgi:predicted DNA-binding protein